MTFIQARLDEREADARAATPGPWVHAGKNRIETPGIDITEADWGPYEDDGETLLHGYDIHCTRDRGAWRVEDVAHIARHDPAWVLADIAAKRALIHAAAAVGEVVDGEWGCSHTAADILAGARIRDGGDPVPLPSSCEGPKELRRLLGPIAALDSTHPDYRQEWAP